MNSQEIFAASSYVTAAVSTLFGIFVFLKSSRRSINRAFFLLAASVSCWAFFVARMISESSAQKALLWSELEHYGVILIPPAYYHFACSVLEIVEQRRQFIRIGYALAIPFFILNAFHLLVAQVSPKSYFNFYENPTGLYNLLLLYFGSLVLWAHWELVTHFQNASPVKKNQIRYLFFASALGFLSGSLTFLPVFGIDAPPLSVLGVACYAFILFYATAKHRLMQVSVAITRMVLLALIYIPLLLVPVAIGAFFESGLKLLFGASWWIVPLAFEALFALAGLAVYRFAQDQAERKLLAEQREYQATLRKASVGMTRIRQLPRLLRLTAGILSRAVGLTHVSIYLQDEEDKRYIRQVAKGKDGASVGVGLGLDDPLIKYLLVHKNAIVLEEFHVQRQQVEDPGLREVEISLRRLGAALVIPSFIHDQLLGFVVMGTKRSGQIYTDDDIKVLMTLSNQAALAIENARFYETEKERQAEMFHTAQLASLGTMAGSMSHQINNRFYVESVVAGAQRTLWQEVDLAGVPEHVRELAQKTIVAFQKIEADAIRGGDIAKTLLNFSKPGKMDRTAFPEIIKLAADLAQYRVKFEEIDFESVVSNPSPLLDGNKNQLTEVFYNLMSNAYDAIKSKEQKIKEGQLTLLAGQGYKGKLAVSATSTAKNGATWLQVVVHDNGIGIKQEDLARLFIPFFTTKATAEKGTGLGLYVIKKIVENHGGRIEVNSAYGEGTTFTIHLPAVKGLPNV